MVKIIRLVPGVGPGLKRAKAAGLQAPQSRPLGIHSRSTKAGVRLCALLAARQVLLQPFGALGNGYLRVEDVNLRAGFGEHSFEYRQRADRRNDIDL